MEDQIARPRLTSRERRILRLRYVEGMKLREIAGMYQCHLMTVSRWEHRAIGKIRQAGGYFDNIYLTLRCYNS